MTKKEKAKQALGESHGIYPPILTILQLIIDALPEERPKNLTAAESYTQLVEEIEKRRREGPEPKDERTTQPTFPQQPIVTESNGTRHFKANEIVRFVFARSTENMNSLADASFTNEERRQFAQLIGYTVDGYNELSYVQDADVGQRSDPPAPAIPSVGPRVCIDGEDARKLRIMKAMEGIATDHRGAMFYLHHGQWVTTGSDFGARTVEDNYQPLWEGDAWVRDRDKAITDIGPAVCGREWRRIKVREVR